MRDSDLDIPSFVREGTQRAHVFVLDNPTPFFRFKITMKPNAEKKSFSTVGTEERITTR